MRLMWKVTGAVDMAYGVIVIASGKGGTGKTTVATNLAVTASIEGLPVCYMDCDVEEPNGHLFLKPVITDKEPSYAIYPQVDQNLCNACGKCAEFCAFNALAVVGKQVLVFPSLCHGCGGCMLICPSWAISEQHRQAGSIDSGHSHNVEFVQGCLDVGEAHAAPLVKQAKKHINTENLTLIDAPPGTSCPVIASVHGVDYVVLVTEPTPFGLHDLKLAVEMLKVMNRPFGVVINRSGRSDPLVQDYWREQNIEVLACIPDDRYIAQAYSRGKMVVEALPEYLDVFKSLLSTVMNRLDASKAAARSEAI
ncbi:MAG: ATP-binding protein [Armatimonadota bacterium]